MSEDKEKPLAVTSRGFRKGEDCRGFLGLGTWDTQSKDDLCGWYTLCKGGDGWGVQPGYNQFRRDLPLILAKTLYYFEDQARYKFLVDQLC